MVRNWCNSGNSSVECDNSHIGNTCNLYFTSFIAIICSVHSFLHFSFKQDASQSNRYISFWMSLSLVCCIRNITNSAWLHAPFMSKVCENEYFWNWGGGGVRSAFLFSRSDQMYMYLKKKMKMQGLIWVSTVCTCY